MLLYTMGKGFVFSLYFCLTITHMARGINVPAKMLKMRFTPEEIEIYERIIRTSES